MPDVHALDPARRFDHWLDPERPGHPDAYLVFTTGWCWALAWEIHDLTGWPILLADHLVDPHGEHHWRHAAVLRPDETLLDIDGTRPLDEEALTTWTPLADIGWLPADLAFHCHPPEAYGTQELADEVIRRARTVARPFARVLVHRHPADLHGGDPLD